MSNSGEVRKQFKVVIRDKDGHKHKFTYRAVDEFQVEACVKRIVP